MTQAIRSNRKRFAWAAGVFFLTICFLWMLHAAREINRLTSVTIPHSYAAWMTGDLLVEYMKTHHGKWPKNWDELREANDDNVKKHLDFDKLPGFVKIDWRADPEKLRVIARAGESIKVVTQLDGTKLEARWGEDTEPNRKVAEYLTEHPVESNTLHQ